MFKVLQVQVIAAIAPITVAVTYPLAAVSQTTAVPEIAEYLPQDTAYLIMLDMRNETWQQLDQYALFQQLDAQGVDVFSPGSLPLLPFELDYREDIEPWLGDKAALALMPLDRPEITRIEDNEVLIAPIAHPEEFDGFLRKIVDIRDAYPDVQNDQTFSIYVWEPTFFEPAPIPEFPPLDPVEPIPPTPSDSPDVDASPSFDPADQGSSLDSIPSESVLPQNTPHLSAPTVPSESAAESSISGFSKAIDDDDEIELDLPPEPIVDTPGLAIAVFPDFMVAAESPAAIRAWADHRPETVADSLASNDRFLRTLAHPNYDGSFGLFYGSLSEMVKYSLADIALPDLPIDIPLPNTVPPDEIAQLAALQLDSSIEVLMYPTARGIRLQGRGYYDDTLLGLLPSLTEPAPEDVLEYTPGDSYGVLSGHNIADFWESVETILAASEETNTVLQQADEILSALVGLTLDEVFGWMDQGFSVFVFPTEDSPANTFVPQVNLGLGIALQTSDRAAAEYAFTQLDQTLENLFVFVEPELIGEMPATSWSSFLDFDDQPDSFLGHGWADDDIVIVTTSFGSLSDVFTLEPAQALPNSLRFLWATEDFPEENQGYGYVNLASVRSLFFRLFPVFPGDAEWAEFQQLSGGLRAASASLSFSDDYLQLDTMLMLSPAEQPE